MVNQFDSYYIEPNIHHNGKLVLGESIGDLAGVKIAYLAFQKSQKASRQPDHRRLHAGPAILYRLGTVPRRRDASGDAAQDGPGRSASDREVPRHRTAVELPAIPEAFSCKADSAWCGRPISVRGLVGRPQT